jgi:hypothetical protein
MNKYNPCCDRRCLVYGCKTKETGGCYCVCRLIDAKNDYERILEDNEFTVQEVGIIHFPREIYPICEETKQKNLKNLEDINRRIKEYEN